MIYYIVEQNQKTGPFDFIAIMKKVKNGSITDNTMLANGDGVVRTAAEFEEVAEIFSDKNTDAPNVLAFKNINADLNFKRCLQIGLKQVGENPLSMAFSGAIVAIILGMAFLLREYGFLGYLLISVAFYVLYSAYFIYIMRLNRGQHAGLEYIANLVAKNLPATVLAGLAVTFSYVLAGTQFGQSMAAGALFVFLAIMGLFIHTTLIFVPLITVEGNVEFKRAVALSFNRVMALSWHSFGILFGLIVINFIGILMLAAPFVFTLPFTLFAIADAYEELFVH